MIIFAVTGTGNDVTAVYDELRVTAPLASRSRVPLFVGVGGVGVGLVGAIALVVAAAVFGTGPALGLWWHVAGDSTISLVDGTVLTEAPPSTSAPVLTRSVWSFPRDVDRLQQPLAAGSAVVVTTQAQLRAKAPYLVDGAGGTGTKLDRPTVVLPSGTVSYWAGAPDGGLAGILRFVGGPHAPAAGRDDDRRALVARIYRAWRPMPDGVTVEVVPALADSAVTYWVQLRLPTCPVCVITTADQAQFSPSGALEYLSVTASTITGWRPMSVIGAVAAFDAARHHRDTSSLSAQVAPIRDAILAFDDLTIPTQPIWLLMAGDGRDGVVASVSSDPAES